MALSAWEKDSRRDQIRNYLEAYKQAIDRRVCAEIDAGCCQTRMDYKNKHDAQEQEEDVLTLVERKLFALADCSEAAHAPQTA